MLMKPSIPQPQQEHAADYVLDQLSNAGLATRSVEDAALQIAVKEMTDAAAAVVFATKQVLPPPNPVRRNAGGIER